MYNEPLAEDAPHATGFISEALLADCLPEDRDVDFYFLGPKPFMQAVNAHAKALAIPAAQVHFEFFGPLQELDVGSEDEEVAA